MLPPSRGKSTMSLCAKHPIPQEARLQWHRMMTADPASCRAQATVEEAMLFSAKLRLPADVTPDVLADFVNEIMEVVELTPLRNALVGLPGASAQGGNVLTPDTHAEHVKQF